jgi:glucose/mannose transport system permease protein
MECARIDGAGVIRTFIQIVLPLAGPAFVVVAIFQFPNVWNDFLFGVTILPAPDRQPVTMVILSGSCSVDWNVVMAGAVITALPAALVYILCKRYFIRGIR